MLLAACAGMSQTDWQTRIGRDSLTDVTRELGRPESCIGLDDGGTACSWLTAKDKERVEKLILTFTPNGKLSTFNQVRF
jgi:pimeloyl-ACP methyl ester carboxylesterase